MNEAKMLRDLDAHIDNDLDRVHFCSNRVKYRKHITMGLILSNLLSLFGYFQGYEWLAFAAIFANTVTSLIWVWE